MASLGNDIFISVGYARHPKVNDGYYHNICCYHFMLNNVQVILYKCRFGCLAYTYK